MCTHCEKLHLYDHFRSRGQFAHEISKIRALVSEGNLSVINGNVPLGEVTGEFSGFARFELVCSCGQRFAVWYDDNGKNGADGGLCLLKS